MSQPAYPNIQLICSDQLRPFELGCYGHPVLRTPHIDRLAARAVRFVHAITPNPVCSPARASLLAGQYARSATGMLGCCGEPSWSRAWFPDSTLPERLQTAGYATLLSGKWHLEPQPRLVGFQEASFPRVWHLNRGQVYFDETGQSTFVGGYCPDHEIAVTRAFMQRSDERPFFVFHNISLPHMPFYDVPEAYLQMYDPADLDLRPNCWIDGELYHDEHAFRVYLYDHLVTKMNLGDRLELPPDLDLHTLYALYCGCVSAVDDQVGRLLDALDASGKADDTIVVFTADHGENMGSHHRWNKISPNDESLRIPYLVSWPQRLAPRVNDGHVASLVDLAPTLLALAGLPVPASMQGRDLTPILGGEADRIGDGEAYAEILRGELVIRTPTHKVTARSRTGTPGPAREILDAEHEFYDLREDPYELRNLAHGDEQRAVAADLRERLLAWDRDTPWRPGSRGGVYGAGPIHDPAPGA